LYGGQPADPSEVEAPKTPSGGSYGGTCDRPSPADWGLNVWGSVVSSYSGVRGETHAGDAFSAYSRGKNASALMTGTKHPHFPILLNLLFIILAMGDQLWWACAQSGSRPII